MSGNPSDSSPSAARAIIRDLHTLPEFRAAVDLEQQIWGYTDSSDLVTVPVFIITVKRGGILIGAFDNDRMIGFAFSIVGIKAGRPMQWSHMMGVLPAYRRTGLGRQLKLAQRERALAGGFDLMEWTFDPLQALNAHLNFARLGVVCDEYVENLYGDSTSSLHRGTPTDRFVVQWHMTAPHVARRIAPPAPLAVREQDALEASTVNETAAGGPWRRPAGIHFPAGERRVCVEVPVGFTEMQQEAPDLALEWRLHSRAIFQTLFGRGYRAVDFLLDREQGRGRYLFVAAET